MSNVCTGTLGVRGSEEGLRKTKAILMGEADKHLARSEFTYIGKAEGVEYYFFDCAWSVYSCMCSGEHTYYGDGKNAALTTLQEISEENGVFIEVYAEEIGIGFREHYVYDNGKEIVADCEDIEEE